MSKHTPAANWRDNKEPDPHGNRYECERADLYMGELTDDEIANAMYLYDHRNGLSSMAYLEAGKDRIRWLSRKLGKAERQNAELLEALIKHGRHSDDCWYGHLIENRANHIDGSCTCGYSQAIAKAKGEV